MNVQCNHTFDVVSVCNPVDCVVFFFLTYLVICIVKDHLGITLTRNNLILKIHIEKEYNKRFYDFSNDLNQNHEEDIEINGLNHHHRYVFGGYNLVWTNHFSFVHKDFYWDLWDVNNVYCNPCCIPYNDLTLAWINLGYAHHKIVHNVIQIIEYFFDLIVNVNANVVIHNNVDNIHINVNLLLF